MLLKKVSIVGGLNQTAKLLCSTLRVAHLGSVENVQLFSSRHINDREGEKQATRGKRGGEKVFGSCILLSFLSRRVVHSVNDSIDLLSTPWCHLSKQPSAASTCYSTVYNIII